jgi:hypothetical protein
MKVVRNSDLEYYIDTEYPDQVNYDKTMFLIAKESCVIIWNNSLAVERGYDKCLLALEHNWREVWLSDTVVVITEI